MIYFDNAATTRPSERALDKALEMFKTNFGNPSSLHNLGFMAEKAVLEAKDIITRRLPGGELIFTSGGTESNNLAIIGAANAYARSGRHIITSDIEHPSVKNVFKHLSKNGFLVSVIPADDKGYVDLERLYDSVTKETVLVSINHVASETGTVQNISGLAKAVKDKNPGVIFHSDCVQSFGRLDIDNKYIDLLSVSGHKLHAPKGVGALYIKKGVRIKPIMFGGNQQNGIRSGTENAPAIAAFGVSAAEAYEGINSNFNHVLDVKNKLLEIISLIDGVHVNGDALNGSPYILNLTFEGIKGEVLLHTLEDSEIYISTGSACSEKHKKRGGDESAVRFSFSRENTVLEAERCVEVLKRVVPELRRFMRK